MGTWPLGDWGARLVTAARGGLGLVCGRGLERHEGLEASGGVGLWCCRGCLGPLDPEAQAGLCGRCWAGLVPLPEARCGRCALAHGPAPGRGLQGGRNGPPTAGPTCPEPVAWDHGDALWSYHAGRPAMGPLLVPAIKRGELGWKAALLERAGRAPWPDFLGAADLVCAAPTSWPRRWGRGFDLAEEAGAMFARALGIRYRPLLRKAWWVPAQSGAPEGRRRRLPAAAVGLRRGCDRGLRGATVLLVDDVWTTGTTLLRCAGALERAGARVYVLALFRALPND